MDSLVSVIMPTYNRGNRIINSMKSVLNQTYENLELIVVDDGSTDNTENVIKQLKDARIKYISYENNKGPSFARNLGLDHARGEFISFQDSDDEWVPTNLECQLDHLNECDDKNGVVYSSIWFRSLDGEKHVFPNENLEPKEGNVLESLLKTNFVYIQSVLTRKSNIEKAGKFDVDLPSAEDWDLYIRLAKSCRFYFNNNVLATAKLQKDSMTLSLDKTITAHKMILKKYREDYERAKKTSYSWQLSHIGNMLALSGDIKSARSYFNKSLFANPLYLKNIIRLVLSLGGNRFYLKLRNIGSNVFPLFKRKRFFDYQSGR